MCMNMMFRSPSTSLPLALLFQPGFSRVYTFPGVFRNYCDNMVAVVHRVILIVHTKHDYVSVKCICEYIYAAHSYIDLYPVLKLFRA